MLKLFTEKNEKKNPKYVSSLRSLTLELAQISVSSFDSMALQYNQNSVV